MERIINSNMFKWFRKSFLKTIHNRIEIDKSLFCCNVKSWHSWFICWKDLKEVQENLDSEYIHESLKGKDTILDCGYVWFMSKQNRLAFLKECLNKL